MAERIPIHPRNLAFRKQQLLRWNLPEPTKSELIQFLQDLELGKVNRGKKISISRQLKYLDLLRIPLTFVNKPTEQWTLADVESFEQALATGQVASRFYRRPYLPSTQAGIRQMLKIFLRWRLGALKAEELAGWLDTREQAKTPEFLTEQEVESLYEACTLPGQRFLLAVLFDSGARAEEFHNIRLEDIQLPTGNDNFVRIALKEEYSKTLGRTVSLYWRHSNDAVRAYLHLRLEAGVRAGDPVFVQSYPAAQKFLRRLGARVLRRRLHYHLFRHSSATYYATRLNRQELCYRYGWKFSSDMPDVYISRAGMQTKDLDQKFTQTELGTLKEDLVKMAQTTRIKDDRIRQLEETMQTLQKNLDAISQVLSLHPTEADVKAALRRKEQLRRLKEPSKSVGA